MIILYTAFWVTDLKDIQMNKNIANIFLSYHCEEKLKFKAQWRRLYIFCDIYAIYKRVVISL
jgi:hypothetical protein